MKPSIPIQLLLALPLAALANPKVPAFPGAEGAGGMTPGGRGGKIIEVTQLADSGPGSFRAALEASGPRIVVFRVSGLITLSNRVAITSPFLTVAGQSAPGEGICVRGETTEINTHDVVIRHVRFRRGNLTRRDDALGGYPVGNIILDHCSFSWGLDENVSLYRWIEKTADGKDKKRPAENVTIQWCISSEALNLHNHAFGGTWGGKNVSFHHNLFACNTGRNPSIGYGDHVDYRNNVIFNWQHRTMDGGDASSWLNVVANYYKPGPAANKGEIEYRICKPQHLDMFSEAATPGKWYVAENVVEGHPRVTADNWDGGVQFDDSDLKHATPTELVTRVRGLEPFPAVKIRQQPAAEAYKLVLEKAGATLPARDPVDARIIDFVRTGQTRVGQNGIIKLPEDAGGWPRYKTSRPAADTDHDGMPDAWEKKHRLDPKEPADGSKDSDADGYTNVEEFLNRTDPGKFVDYSKPENNVDSLP